MAKLLYLAQDVESLTCHCLRDRGGSMGVHETGTFTFSETLLCGS